MLTWFLLGCALVAAPASASACADGGSCEEGYSCCSSGHNHRCCPFKQAVCCADRRHCCPHGQRCNIKEMRCESGLESSPWFEQIPAVQRLDLKVNTVRCNQTAFCRDGSTCCRTSVEDWGCCPLPQAVCCADRRHCCPHGQRCNIKEMRCESGLESSPWFEQIPVIQRLDLKDVSTHVMEDVPASFAQTTAPRVEEDFDEDEEEEEEEKEEEEVELKISCNASVTCPNFDTCCFMQDLQVWGCCPLTMGVCCPGGMYCCPQHYTCNLQTNKCVKGDETSASLQSTYHQCDGTSRCPAGNTCCRLPAGEWGCCPLLNAVCCSEWGGCCPHGSSCTQDGECLMKPRFDWSIGKMPPSEGRDPGFM